MNYDYDLRFGYCVHENSAYIPDFVLQLHGDTIQTGRRANYNGQNTVDIYIQYYRIIIMRGDTVQLY